MRRNGSDDGEGKNSVTHAGSFLRDLSLGDFTAFGEARFQFLGPGINVFVGENGVGKTHAMKLLFAWMLHQNWLDAQDRSFVTTLVRTMQANSEDDLVRHGAAENRATIDLKYGNRSWNEVLFNEAAKFRGQHADLIFAGVPRPVFIPTIEMMGHTKGFGDIYDVYGLDFDWTVRDIVRLLRINRISPAPEYAEVLRQLQRDALNGGTVEYDDEEERFYLTKNGYRQAMPMVAEGLRKVGTLYRLLQNGSLKQGTALFWDEPEVNLNPVLMDEIVRALIAVSRSGVQIFLATHSYVLLEELRDAALPDEVRYFGFERGKDGVTVNATDDLAALRPNPILKQYESLYNRKMHRAFADNSLV